MRQAMARGCRRRMTSTVGGDEARVRRRADWGVVVAVGEVGKEIRGGGGGGDDC